MGDQLALTLRLIDPFDASAERSTTTDPRFYQVSERRRLERGVLLSVNWSFGRAPEVRRDDEDRGEEREEPVAE